MQTINNNNNKNLTFTRGFFQPKIFNPFESQQNF